MATFELRFGRYVGEKLDKDGKGGILGEEKYVINSCAFLC